MIQIAWHLHEPMFHLWEMGSVSRCCGSVIISKSYARSKSEAIKIKKAALLSMSCNDVMKKKSTQWSTFGSWHVSLGGNTIMETHVWQTRLDLSMFAEKRSLSKQGCEIWPKCHILCIQYSTFSINPINKYSFMVFMISFFIFLFNVYVLIYNLMRQVPNISILFCSM